MDDVLELFLADTPAPGPKAPEPVPPAELDLLLEEFQSATDPGARKDALLAVMKLIKGF